jgi:hypothetical protein
MSERRIAALTQGVGAQIAPFCVSRTVEAGRWDQRQAATCVRVG